MVLLQADVTANNAEHAALLKRFRLFGPPGIVFFDREGREIQGLRVIGFQPADRFAAVLDQVLELPSDEARAPSSRCSLAVAVAVRRGRRRLSPVVARRRRRRPGAESPGGRRAGAMRRGSPT